MKYLCLIYSDERQWATMPLAEYDAVLGEYFAFTEQIRGEGKYLAGEDLEPTRTASRIPSARYGAIEVRPVIKSR